MGHESVSAYDYGPTGQELQVAKVATAAEFPGPRGPVRNLRSVPRAPRSTTRRAHEILTGNCLDLLNSRVTEWGAVRENRQPDSQQPSPFRGDQEKQRVHGVDSKIPHAHLSLRGRWTCRTPRRRACAARLCVEHVVLDERTGGPDIDKRFRVHEDNMTVRGRGRCPAAATCF